MAIYSLRQYPKAGETDLVEMAPVAGGHPLFVAKWVLEVLVIGLAHHQRIHLSGPTGSAKSSLIEALADAEAKNFATLCGAIGLAPKPLRVFPVVMVAFDSPGELYSRRALRGGETFDEDSRMVAALLEAARASDDVYPAVWMREMGRVHAPSVQNGLLDLVHEREVLLPDGRRIRTDRTAYIADSNYRAEEEGTYTLVAFDDGLKRRLVLNVPLEYLPSEQEAEVLRHLVDRERDGRRTRDEQIAQVIHLGQVIRRHRGEGNLRTIAPPTIDGYLTFLRITRLLPHLSPRRAALATLLAAGPEDANLVAGVCSEVFGVKADEDVEATAGAGLF